MSPLQVTHLDPGVPVVRCGAPGVHQALVVEASELGPPALQPQQAVADRRGRDLGLCDPPALHAEQRNTTCPTVTRSLWVAIETSGLRQPQLVSAVFVSLVMFLMVHFYISSLF